MVEPDLTQAIRIVLKYEIQSLLQRLSDTGEEYIVITASTEEKTSGHMVSDKGETFFQASGLYGVKQDFLDFCTGFNASMTSEDDTPHSETVEVSKQRQGKSTSRGKYQTVPDVGSKAQNGNAASCHLMVTKGSEENGHKTVSVWPDSSHDEPLVVVVKTEPKLELENENSSSVWSGSGGQVKPRNYIGEQSWDSQNKNYRWTEEKVVNSATSRLSAESSEESRFHNPPQYLKKAESNVEDGKITTRSESAHMRNSLRGSKTVCSKFPLEQSATSSYEKAVKRRSGIQSLASDRLTTSSRLTVPDARHQITGMENVFITLGNMAKCLLCEKILSNKNNRAFHWRSHVGDKRYACDICGKKFVHPSNMKSHRKIHTDEKRFKCKLCDRKFRRQDYLMHHVGRFHSDENLTEKMLSEDGVSIE